jgi:thioredoxin 1
MRNTYSYQVTEKISQPVRRAREIIDTSRGAVVVEFGMPWGEHCRVVEPLLASVFARHTEVQHVKVDGSGRRLSKLFNVKFWPTLIFLYDGKEVMRLVRPNNIAVIDSAFTTLANLSETLVAEKAHLSEKNSWVGQQPAVAH